MLGNKLKTLKIALLSGLLLPACQSATTPGKPESLVRPALQSELIAPRELLKVNRMALLPVQFQERVPLALRNEAPFDLHLYRSFRKTADAEVIASSDLPGDFPAEVSLNQVASLVPMLETIEADSVLYTRINRFTPRKGSAIGVTQAAAVDLQVFLFGLPDLKPIWRASYHYTDEELSKNLLRMEKTFAQRRGEGWQAADDILQAGFLAASEKLAAERLVQFSSRNRK